MSFESQYATSC